MNITIKASKSFTTSDASVFTERTDAVAHEKKLARALQLVSAEFDYTGVSEEDEHGIYVEDLPRFIAHNAEVILAALTVRESRGRKAKSVPAEAEAA